jgi:hypothetical protein
MKTLMELWESITDLIPKGVAEIRYKVGKKGSLDSLKIFYTDPITGNEDFIILANEKDLEAIWLRINDEESYEQLKTFRVWRMANGEKAIVKVCEGFYTCLERFDDHLLICVSPKKSQILVWKELSEAA